MTKKQPKRQMSEEHRLKLSQRYWERKRQKELGIHIPTRKEEKEAARAAKAPVTEQSVNHLVNETPVTEENARINTPIFFKPDIASDNAKHPARFRDTHERIEKLQK